MAALPRATRAREVMARTGATAPVWLAPMAGTSGGLLAAEVALAGGVGLLGAAFQTPAWIRAEWAVATERAGAGRRPQLGIGLAIFDVELRPEMLETTLACRPAIVWLGFGDPAPYVARLHAVEAIVAMQVNSVAEAERAVQAGVDVVVAQGTEAGGHGRTQSGTLALVPAIVDRLANTAVPVVAAGGIADGRGLAAALALGASAVAMGTRFYASTESAGAPAFKQLIVEAAEGAATVRTPVFDTLGGSLWPTEYDGRALRNSSSARYEGRLGDIDDVAVKRYLKAVKERDASLAAVWAGESVGLIRSVLPAAQIVRDVVEEARRVASQLPSKL